MGEGEKTLHLVNRLIERDEQALIELMDQYGDYLLRTAYLLLNDYQKAEEAVQDSFVIVYRKIDQLQHPTKLKSWLTTIVINQCRTRLRTWSWKHVFLQFEVFEKTKDEGSMFNPEEHLLEVIQNNSIREAIQQLDYIYREVITLYYFNEMKITEIASHTKTKENTVKSRLKRGRALLKELLTKGDVYFGGKKAESEKEA